MKLYYAQGACSLAPHIVLQESGLQFQLEPVSLQTKKTRGGADYAKINPKGAVPALELDNGQVLTEGAVIMQYVADQKPEKKLIPAAGTLERYRAQEWLNFIATEVHKGFAPLWSDTTPAETKAQAKTTLGKKFDYLSERLKGQDYLMGTQMTAPDAYLFTVLNWTSMLSFDMATWPTLLGFMERMRGRPAVQAAMKAEGLVK